MDKRKEVESLIATLKTHGINVTDVDSGPGMEYEPATIDNIMAAGAPTIGLQYRDDVSHTVMSLVLDNEPGYIVSDWLIPKNNNFAMAIETAVEEYGNQWEEE